MDESTPNANKQNQRKPLASGSFNNKEQQQFGLNIRLAMECIEGKVVPTRIKAMPSNADDIRQRLKMLSQDVNSSHADLLELLVRYDDLEGWKSGGATHCAAWMNLEIGISLQLGWEYLRVGRKLRLLPTTTALFRVGKLSWSKVRLIVNVADKDNEKTLCHAALDGSVSEVKRLCDEYRWQEDDEDGKKENDRALKQWQSRSFTWQETPIGSTCIKLTLPPELAQAFLNSVEQSLSLLDNNGEDNDNQNEANISQRRADAAVLMAENSLQNAGREIATADRYQVLVSVDSNELTSSTHTSSTETSSIDNPRKRPTINSAGPIASETAKRIACDCCISTQTTSNGEPINIGRKSRIGPSAMSRAITTRDQHCQYPGCTRTQHLQIHHIVHWADGGETSISNGVCLCSFHHSLVHEGGYTIENVSDNELLMQEQYEQQRHTNDSQLFEFEKDLRNDQSSFDKIRQLSPTRYRFRVNNAQGVDVRTLLGASDSSTGSPLSYQTRHSTRVECAEPKSWYSYHVAKVQTVQERYTEENYPALFTSHVHHINPTTPHV